jgi:hypothetical protein
VKSCCFLDSSFAFFAKNLAHFAVKFNRKGHKEYRKGAQSGSYYFRNLTVFLRLVLKAEGEVLYCFLKAAEK